MRFFIAIFVTVFAVVAYADYENADFELRHLQDADADTATDPATTTDGDTATVDPETTTVDTEKGIVDPVLPAGPLSIECITANTTTKEKADLCPSNQTSIDAMIVLYQGKLGIKNTKADPEQCEESMKVKCAEGKTLAECYSACKELTCYNDTVLKYAPETCMAAAETYCNVSQSSLTASCSTYQNALAVKYDINETTMANYTCYTCGVSGANSVYYATGLFGSVAAFVATVML